MEDKKGPTEATKTQPKGKNNNAATYSGVQKKAGEKYTEAELRENAAELFKKDKDLDFVFGTTDGNLFLPEAQSFAANHAVRIGDKEPMKIRRK